MRTLLVALSALALAGCSATDPCAGKSGTCIALRIEGPVSDLDQLSISVDQPTPKTETTAMAAFSLPVEIALDFPGGVTGTVNVGVVAFGGGTARGSGQTSVTITGNRGKGTVQLTSAVPDLGIDLEGPDFAGADLEEACSTVTECKSGDGCCPTGCTHANDDDCAVIPVCGNHIVEGNEVCDDGNTMNGDGCDPTCQWTNTLSTVSGIAGGAAHADDANGLYARFDGAAGIAGQNGGSTLFVIGNDNTIREIDLTDPANPATTTYSGALYMGGSNDGAVATATYGFPSLIEYLPATSTLYLYDGTALRTISANTVATLALSPSLPGSIIALGHSGASIIFYVANSGLYELTGATSYVQLATNAQFAALTPSTSNCVDIACASAVCYIACGQNIVSFPVGGGTPVSYAGIVGNPGCSSGTPLAATQFTNVNSIDVDASGNLIVGDAGCDTISKISTSAGTVTTIAGMMDMPAYQDGVGASARFSDVSGLVQLGTTTYVADSDTVRAINGTTVTTAAGRPRNPVASSYASGPVASPNFAVPWNGFASDGAFVYGVDSEARVLKTTIATGSTTQLQPSLPSGSFLSGAVIVGTTLYLASQSTGTISTAKLDGSNGTLYAGIAGMTTPPTDNPVATAVINPQEITTNGKQIFFTDNGTLVRMIDLTTNVVSTLAGTLGTTTVMDGTGTGASFARLGPITADGANVYVADGNAFSPFGPPTCIRRIAIATGKVDTVAGSASALGHVDAIGLAARFGGITALTTDGTSLFVGEGDSAAIQGLGVGSNIRQVVIAGFSVTTMLGKPDQSSFRPDVGLAARVDFPNHLVFEPLTHSLFLFDEGQYVLGRIK